MANNLAVRLKAEQKYMELQSKAKVSRALNSRAAPSQQYLPGDLISKFSTKDSRPLAIVLLMNWLMSHAFALADGLVQPESFQLRHGFLKMV